MQTRRNAQTSLPTDSDDESLIRGAHYRHTHADDSVTLEYRDLPLPVKLTEEPEPVHVHVEHDMAVFDGNESSSRRPPPTTFKRSAAEDPTPSTPFAPRTFGSLLPEPARQKRKRKQPFYAPPISDEEVQQLGLWERVYIANLSKLNEHPRYQFAGMVAAQSGIRSDQLYLVRTLQRELDDLEQSDDETDGTVDESPVNAQSGRRMAVSGNRADFEALIRGDAQNVEKSRGVLLLGPTLTSNEEMALDILKDQYPEELNGVQLADMEQSTAMRPMFALLVASYVNMTQYVGGRRAPHVTDYNFYGQRAKRAIERFRDARYDRYRPAKQRVWVDRDATVNRRNSRHALASYCIGQSSSYSSDVRETRSLFNGVAGYRPYF